MLEHINDALEAIPEEVELMTAQSINNIRKLQGTQVSTLAVQLDDITDYLTRINFYKPFKDLLSSYTNQLKKNVSVVLNGSFKLQADIDTYSKTQQQDTQPLSERIAQIQSDCEECLQSTDALHQTFLLELNSLLSQLNNTLDINKIVEQYEILHPQAKLESKRSRLKGQVKQYQNKVFAFVHQLVTNIVQTKEVSEKNEHETKHHHLT